MGEQKSFQFKVEVPIYVSCHRRDDNSVSVDLISVPSEETIYEIVDRHAKQIKAFADVVV